jgi:pimeloyl-ACP methyl ester carboxylesterase
MSRTAKVTLAATAVFAASGLSSGLLFDEYGGVLGAVETVLRMIVVVSAAVMLAGAFVLVLRLRRRPRSRVAGWLLAAVASVAFIWLAAVPVGYGVYLTNLPTTKPVVDADLGADKETVTLEGAHGLRIRGWYVASRNGAAVIAMHGTGGSRSSMSSHTRLLARHGYGVLALDLRGHGESEGRSTSLPWVMDDDIGAAIRWLQARPDVDASRIGAVGVSMGGEVALRAAVHERDLRAMVVEGAMGSAGDAKEAGADIASLAQLRVMSAVGDVLSGSRAGSSDGDLVARIAPRPILLISAGNGIEAEVNRGHVRRTGPSIEHWNLPDAPHGSALRIDPAGYEQHVVSFLDRALRR